MTMPYTKTPRPYKHEYEMQKKRDESKPRAERAAARYKAEKSGQISPDMVIDHIKPLSKGGSNAKSNLRIVPRKDNASFSRNHDHSVKVNKPKRKR
jgi:5-methylcytosine-specific restriction endonuclease McrA